MIFDSNTKIGRWTDCYFDGREDGTADKPFNETRNDGRDEAAITTSYEEGYKFGCQNKYSRV